MKKIMVLFLLAFVLILGACGGAAKDTKTVPAIKQADKIEITLASAKPGDIVTDDWGTYTIEKVIEPNSAHESGPVTFNLQKVLLATFIPSSENSSFFDKQEFNLAITLINSENTSEDTVSFDPYATLVVTDTKGQYEAQSGLNKGESKYIGNVIQEFTTAFNLEDEKLSDLKELKFVMDGTVKDGRTIGDDVTIVVPFE